MFPFSPTVLWYSLNFYLFITCLLLYHIVIMQRVWTNLCQRKIDYLYSMCLQSRKQKNIYIVCGKGKLHDKRVFPLWWKVANINVAATRWRNVNFKHSLQSILRKRYTNRQIFQFLNPFAIHKCFSGNIQYIETQTFSETDLHWENILLILHIFKRYTPFNIKYQTP